MNGDAIIYQQLNKRQLQHSNNRSKPGLDGLDVSRDSIAQFSNKPWDSEFNL